MKEDEKRNLLLNECVRYLKKSSAFQKLLAGFREKYRSLGHWGGTVVLKELSREERMDLGGFLAKDLLKKDDVRITASQMEKALSGTRFAELEWEEILEQYFGRPLITKKADLAAKNTQKDVFFKEIFMIFSPYSSKIFTISPSRIRFIFLTAQKFPHMEQVSSFSGLEEAR